MIDWPVDLVSAIARRRGVIILGAGVSASASNVAGRNPRTWRAFLLDAAGQLNPCPKHIKDAIAENRLLDACQLLKDAHENNWLNILRDEFVAPMYRESRLHELIYQLDVRTTISLNFDSIYDAYVQKVTEGTFVVKNYYDDDIRQVVAGSDRYLLKMHGSVDTPRRMIFSGKDYARARVEHKKFYELIRSLLHTHVCLLIGCGLNDPDVQMLFEDYRHSIGETPHYQTTPGPLSSQVRGLVRDNRGINLLSYNKKDNHKELLDSLASLVDKVSSERATIATNLEW